MGGLTVLNWAGFKAAVSYNFDDANSSQIANYNPSGGTGLKSLDVPFTFFLIGDKIAQGPTSTWATILKDGHEFGNHTWDHNTVSQSNVDQGKSTIESDFPGVKVHTFAEPNGTAGYEQFAEVAHFISRGVADGLMMPGNEATPPWFNTYCYIPPAGAPASDFENEINGARSAGGWRVILVHGFTTVPNGSPSDGAYQPVPLASYVSGVQYAKSFGDVWIDTMTDVGAYWRGQNAFNLSTKSTSGSSTTYKWTLPANFPSGHYLRVTVTGGHITQNGETLAWNSHGYYEISLDAGSLTVGP